MNFYHPIHSYLATAVCVFGTVSNSLNMIVLLQKQIRSTASILLIGMAICYIKLDLLHLTLGIHQIIYQAHVPTLKWLIFELCTAHSSFALYGLSTWLTVYLAVVRYSQLKDPSANFQRHKQTIWNIAVLAVGALLCCVPNMLSVELRPNGIVRSDVHWHIGESNFSMNLAGYPLKLAFWCSGVLFFLLPSALLFILICLMLPILHNFKTRRRRLRLSSRNLPGGEPHLSLIFSVLVVFLVTNLPQGVLTILCAFLNQSYRENIFDILAEPMELLLLLNISIGLILNCVISSQFRETFLQVFSHSTNHSLLPTEFQSELIGIGDPIRRSINTTQVTTNNDHPVKL